MSWDGYIENIIGRMKNHCDRVCIIGLKDGGHWTSINHPNAMHLTSSESQHIATAMRKADFTTFHTGMGYVEGKSYTFLRSIDDKIVLARKKDSGAITIQKTKTAVIIAHTKEGGQQGLVNVGVGEIADYLESTGM
ncbi:profilin-like [Hydractinia symbiolongicarpus]|uniref:profilin-like n=1 Tax=Hydractinia symbiolongicarpus TaxID=13093 RepID=UPI00254EEEAC|nr:profilin-like [Hydractinia symbiolongicarpus]